MKKRKLFIPILAGLIVGQIFAEGRRPFTLMNTIRFGYNDNIDRTENGSGSAYIKDIVDLAFNASLSDRTDLTVKSRFTFQSDSEHNLYPNLYAVLSHSVSPRLMLRLSEKYRSGEKTTGRVDGRYNYFINNLGLSATYVLSEKDRLELNVFHRLRQHEEEIEDEDYTTIGAGVAWARDIRPQRTRSKLNLAVRQTEYDKRRLVDSLAGVYTNTYGSRTSGHDALDLTLEVNHTFNPSWQGTIEGGVTYIQPNKRDYLHETPTLTNFVKASDSARLAPIFKLGTTYSPSPRTRFTANYSHTHNESDNSDYVGKTANEFRFGFQHDVTAKILAKATARFLFTEYDEDDDESSDGDSDEERMDLELRFTYKVNRLNFLELALKHSQKSYEDGDGDWDQNLIEAGWRVEL